MYATVKERKNKLAKKILIIDDEPNIVQLLASRLRANGYAVVAAYDAMQAVSVAQKEIPDLIILDIKMPAGGGINAFKAIRRLSNTAAIPVIFITAQVNGGMKEKVLEMGAEDFISKPFEADDLIGKIKEILGENTIYKEQ